MGVCKAKPDKTIWEWGAELLFFFHSFIHSFTYTGISVCICEIEISQMYSYLIKVASFPVFWGICPPSFPLSGADNFSRIVQCVSSSGKSFCYRQLGNSSIMSLSWSRLLVKLCVLCKPLLRAAAGERLWYQVAAAQPSPTLRVISLSACTPRTRTWSFPRSWATSASPAPSTASASRWAPLPRSTLTPLVSSGWQSVSPASPESCVCFLLSSSEMGRTPESLPERALYQLLPSHIWGSFWPHDSLLRLSGLQTVEG